MGRLEKLKTNHGEAMIEDLMLLDDAKAADVNVVCSWLEEKGRTLELGLIHPVAYSASCCIGEVELETVGSSQAKFKFVNETARAALDLEWSLLVKPKEINKPKSKATRAESRAQATALMQAGEEARSAEARAAEAPQKDLVNRGPNKRAATRASAF